MSTDKINTISAMYAAFGQGDVDGVLAPCTDDVQWTTHLDPIVPWAGKYSGKTDVRRFFAAIFESVDVQAFEPLEWVSEGDTVVSIGRFACRARSTGKSDDSRWVFIWKFRGDAVSSYEQFHDHSIADIFRA